MSHKHNVPYAPQGLKPQPTTIRARIDIESTEYDLGVALRPTSDWSNSEVDVPTSQDVYQVLVTALNHCNLKFLPDNRDTFLPH
jgi:hypothetical protein